MIVDGAKALDTAVTQTFGRAALVQRCQVHKGRNILEHLPEAQRPWVKVVLTRAYTNSHVKTAKRLLQDLARRLDTDYPSAATSVREGLDETLTVLGLGLSERLQRSLATTNAIESLLSRTRHVQRHVKRWRGGTMVLRWVAAGVLEAAKGVRRVQGCQDMPALVAALRARDARLGLGESSEYGCVVVNQAAAEFQQRTGHPPCPRPSPQLLVCQSSIEPSPPSTVISRGRLSHRLLARGSSAHRTTKQMLTILATPSSD